MLSVTCDIVWMQEQPLTPRHRLLPRMGTMAIRCIVRRIRWLLDVDTLAHDPAENSRLNEIGRMQLECKDHVVVDGYRNCRGTGALVRADGLFDEGAADVVFDARPRST